MNFDQAFDALIGNEGGYSFNAVDPGGETMWGITSRVARANGYRGDMRALPRDEAKRIARAQYWDAVQGDALPACLRFQVFDAAYNSGPAEAARWLQRAAGVVADGVIGPATLSAAQSSPVRIGILFDAERQQALTDLPTWGAFGRGWARRIANNLRRLAAEI